MATPTLVVVAGSVVIIYVLIKVHLRVTRKLWEPVFEEEVERELAAEGEPAAEGEAADGGDGEADVERDPRGWDEVG